MIAYLGTSSHARIGKQWRSMRWEATGQTRLCTPFLQHAYYFSFYSVAREDGPENSADSSVVSPSAVVPHLNSMSARPCIHFLLWQGLLRQPHWDYHHQDSRTMHLQLWFLSDNPWRTRGFSDRVVDMIEKLWALSKKAHYKSQWDLFVAWASDKGLDPFQAYLPLLTNFLVYLFKVRQISVRVIKKYKSAISFYWKSLSDYEIPGDDQVLSDIFRGFTGSERCLRSMLLNGTFA